MKINISNYTEYHLLKFNQKKLLNFSLRSFFIIIFAFMFCVWGTSWSVPIINIPYSFVWIGITFLAAIFFNNQKLPIKEILILGLLGVSFIFFFIYGLEKNLLSDSTSDFYYTFTFMIKILLGIFLFFVLQNVIKNKEDANLFFLSCSIFISLIILYLSWKYLIVYDQSYIGVVVDDTLRGVKANKNSLATSAALLVPFIYAGTYIKNGFKSFFIIALGLIFFLLIMINSRSAIIISGIEIIAFYFISRSGQVKKYTRNSIILTIIILIFSGISFSDWFLKNNNFSDGGIDELSYSATDNLLETHRGWLLKESLEGYIDSSMLGNGLGTFRIRESNQGSKTDTHNDYILLLYEQGTIGLLLILYLLFWRIKSNLNALRLKSDRFLEASTVSLIGLLVAPIFINMMQTFIFWTIISLSFILTRNQNNSFR